jgi:integrase
LLSRRWVRRHHRAQSDRRAPYQVIAAELRAAILNGALPTGAALPTVKQLGARHHVAPSTAHRAIAMLAAENLVTVSRGRRAVVSPIPTPQAIDTRAST